MTIYIIKYMLGYVFSLYCVYILKQITQKFVSLIKLFCSRPFFNKSLTWGIKQ